MNQIKSKMIINYGEGYKENRKQAPEADCEAVGEGCHCHMLDGRGFPEEGTSVLGLQDER